MTTKSLKVALDWRPNTNHSGFFVAKEKGFYDEMSLDVNMISTEDDNYVVTPCKKVEEGKADFALCPMESIVSYRTKAAPFDAVAIATIYQDDISAVVTLKSSGLDRPSALSGKTYASYKARYEDKIVQTMIDNDGGKTPMKITYPDKLKIWDALLSGDVDATWIFKNWEGVEAQAKGIELNSFTLKDYDIPYSYSPVIMTSHHKFTANKDTYKAFMKATSKGFQYAAANPKEAADILKKYVSSADKDVDLVKSQEMASKHYGGGGGGKWGHMDTSKVQKYFDWLKKQQLEESALLDANTLVTNEVLQ